MTTSDMAVMAELANFGDDYVGGARFLKKNFDRLSDDGNNRAYELVDAHFDDLPKEAQSIIAMLAFRCDVGRKQLSKNLEVGASRLSDNDPLKKKIIG